MRKTVQASIGISEINEKFVHGSDKRLEAKVSQNSHAVMLTAPIGPRSSQTVSFEVDKSELYTLAKWLLDVAKVKEGE